MVRLIGTFIGIGLLLILVAGTYAGSRPTPTEARQRENDANPDPPVVVLSRTDMLDALVRSGAVSKDASLAACPADLRIDVAPDGTLVRTSGLGIYHREHPEIWILADGTCAFDPQAVGKRPDPAVLK